MVGGLKPLFEQVGPGLERLLKQAAAVDALTAAARDRLPDGLGRHLQAAVVHDEELVLVTGQAIWATRLHYAGPALLKALAGVPAASGLKRVRVRVRAPA